MPSPVSSILLALALAAWPCAVFAHPGSEAFIHVPVDHVVPGEPFPIVAADLGPGSTVTIEVATIDGVMILGTVTTDANGHLETELVMPPMVAAGHVQITARSDDGSVATAWVLVGNGALSGSSSGPSTGTGFWIDPSRLLLLGAAAVGALIWMVRSRWPAAAARRRG